MLREDLAAIVKDEDLFQFFHKLDGEVFRNKEGRITKQVTVAGVGYFVKLHYGVGWSEIVKNLISFRLPILGAKPEYEAAVKLKKLGLDTLEPVAYDQRGSNPATQKSLLVTEEILDYDTLEDLSMDWRKQPPNYAVKKRMIERVAQICRVMHGAGINHRDLYLCHFLLKDQALPLEERLANSAIHLIDLHRAQLRDEVPYRWHEKDLGGLYYSVLDIGLNKRDVLRFLRVYFDQPLKKTIKENKKLLKTASWRAVGIYERYHQRSPVGVPL
jgi:heptose I phosphotransferase